MYPSVVSVAALPKGDTVAKYYARDLPFTAILCLLLFYGDARH
jgi:hypothetical protein